MGTRKGYRYPPEMRAKKQGARNAMILFGLKRGRKMEPPAVRESLALMLRMSQNPKIKTLAIMAMDPMHKGTSFVSLMETMDVSYHNLSQEFRELQKSEGFIRAAQHLPELMEQTVLEAKSKDEECWDCKGKGTITKVINQGKADEREETKDCPKCHGSGTIHIMGDTDRLKLIFETFGMTGKGGGLNVNFDLRKPEQHEDLADLAGSLGPILEGSGKMEDDNGTDR